MYPSITSASAIVLCHVVCIRLTDAKEGYAVVMALVVVMVIIRPHGCHGFSGCHGYNNDGNDNRCYGL